MAALLSGIRVVETGVLLTVDYLGRLLGDEGADVVKIETPQTGDYLRNILTRFAPDWATAHLLFNRNKRSITVDARTTEGRDVMARLIAQADVFISGNVGTTNEKLGLDYESIRRIAPGIVYCQATGFGAAGPYAEIPTHGQMMEALGGGTPPLELDDEGFVHAVTTDDVPPGSGVVIGPLFAAFAVAAALVRRCRDGHGAYLDVACADAVLATRYDALQVLNPENVDPTGPDDSPFGSAKYQHYQTKDGRFVLFCAIEPKFWDKFCTAVGREDLRAGHRREWVVDFAGGDRALRKELQTIFHRSTLEEWMQVAIEHDIPMGPALRLDEVRDNPHLRARQMVVHEDHPVVGGFDTLRSPVVVAGEDAVLRPAPAHGEHTDEILTELGFDEESRAHLRRCGVV